MAKVVVKSKVKKAKRKFPVEVKSPEYLNSVTLGHSNVTDLTAMVGKTSKINLMYVTGNVKNQNIRLTFKVVEVSSGLAKTTVKTYEQIPYYLRRFVKKGSDLIESSFVGISKDGQKVRVKPFVVSKFNITKLVSSALRAKIEEILIKDISEKTYDEFISAVIGGKLQSLYRNELKKITPLKAFEFKRVDLE